MAKAKAAGQFLGGILNNPAVVILGGLAIVLLFFQKDIRSAFGGLGEGLGNIDIQLPEIKFPDINFPDINFPDINFPDITFPDFNLDFGAGFGGVVDQITKAFDDFSKQFVPEERIDVPFGDTGQIIDVVPDVTGGAAERRRAQEEAAALAAIPDRDIQDDVEGLTPAQRFGFIERGVIPSGFEVVGGQLQRIMQQITAQARQPIDIIQPVQSFLIDQPFQQFEGGGISFESGRIFETPIENLSLSQIIDKFMVTASQAANLRAIAQGFTPEEEEFLRGSGDIFGFTGFNDPAVSDPQFAGLTPQEIVLRLTGGNISNF